MIIIEQSAIDAPGFPRSPEWWQQFLPEWIAVTVRDDGTVALEPSGLEMHYSTERGLWWEPAVRPAVTRKRQEKSLEKFVREIPRFAGAIRREKGTP